MESAFTSIYDKQVWGNGSGGGSDPEIAKPYATLLQNFLRDNQIKSVVDIGCGDWQFSKRIDWSGIDYTGVDVVRSVVDRNNETFGKPGIRFMQGDITAIDLPRADLVIIKDVMQHWPNAAVFKVLPKLKTYKFALVTNDFASLNKDCREGDTRPLDLQAEPFSVQAELLLTYDRKHVLLFRNG